MTVAREASIQDFVPVENWPSLSERIDAFGAPTSAETDRLAGQSLDIMFENGLTIRHEFTPDQLTWTILGAESSGNSGTHPYRAVEVRPGIVFVDFTKGDGVDTHDVSIVIKIDDGRVTVAETVLVRGDGPTRTRTDIFSGRVDGSGAVEPRERTTELVGKRLDVGFGATERYEHVFLNPGTVAWHCVQGRELGQADVGPAKVFELDDDVVMYFWAETVHPVDAFLVVDLEDHRVIGRMFGWDATRDVVVHVPFDGRVNVVTEPV